MNNHSPWWIHSVFYHIHPLGFCGAPEHNDFHSPATERLSAIADAADHIRGLGCTALYLGPLFESTSHGYDTVDHNHVDRRLGNNTTLRRVVERLHDSGLRVILDGVFNHTGRDHFAFYDLRCNKEASPYRHWFRDLNFSADNRFGDGFTYRAWEGHEELPEFDLSNPEVRDHLLGAVRHMIQDFDVDGLRLDVAYALPPDFLRRLAEFTTGLKDDFFLLGEMIHGNYGRFAADTNLHSLTNYELHKALWSSHNDGNYFELAHSLERHFGHEGLSRHLPLYNFADNHDVPRIASRLNDAGHLFPLTTLLFTLPGIPSVYYGSEFAMEGIKGEHTDAPLRPAWTQVERKQTDLADFIAKLAGLRRRIPALQEGEYRQLHLEHRSFAFERRLDGKSVIIAVNASGDTAPIDLPLPRGWQAAEDLFVPGRILDAPGGVLKMSLPAYGSAVLRPTAGG